MVSKLFLLESSYLTWVFLLNILYSLLLRKECCTFSNGEFVKAGLAELELWCGQVNEVKMSTFCVVLLRNKYFLFSLFYHLVSFF